MINSQAYVVWFQIGKETRKGGKGGGEKGREKHTGEGNRQKEGRLTQNDIK